MPVNTLELPNAEARELAPEQCAVTGHKLSGSPGSAHRQFRRSQVHPPVLQRRNACVDADRALRTGTGGHHQGQPRRADFIVGLLVDKSSAGNWVGLLPSKPLTKALARVRGRHVGLKAFFQGDPEAAIETSHFERALRPTTTGRTNWLVC